MAKISAFGMALEGDLESDGFLIVQKLFPGGPVATAGQGVEEGDVLLAIDDTKLAGLSEPDFKKLVADARSHTQITLQFGRQFALAAGRTIEPFRVDVPLAAAPAEEVVDYDESEVVELGKKANKKSVRAKKAADKASKVKTRLRSADQPMGLSKYSQMVAAMPPVWHPPPPEYPSSEAVAASVATHARRAAALDVASKVWGCGDNSQGELGLGHRRFIWGAKAVQLSRAPLAQGRRNACTPQACAAGEGFSIVCTGRETSVSGTNVNGRLGLGPEVHAVEYFTRIPCLSGIAVQAVACGYDHCILLAKDTTPRAYAWGGNAQGQLGLGSARGTCDKPTELVSLRGKSFSHVAAGKAHTLLLPEDGRAVLSFGAHEHGQLGRHVHAERDAADGECWEPSAPRPVSLPFETTGDHHLAAGHVGDLRHGVTAGSAPDRVVAIAAGAHHSLLITMHGSVLTFGRNDAGQCGCRDPATLLRPTKMALPATERAELGACGALHSVVVCRDTSRPSVCSVYSCGSGGSWQLGSGLSQEDRYAPELVETMAGRCVTAVACGMFHTLCVVAEDGGPSSLWAWGADLFGDMRHVDGPSAEGGERPLRGSDFAARGLAGRVRLNAFQQVGVQLKGLVTGSSARHALLLLAWQLPWHLERVLWIGLLKGDNRCPLSRLPLDGPRTSFLLAKIIEMVSAPP